MREFKSEKDWSDWLLAELTAIPKSFWFRPPTKTLRGIPDIIGCLNGHFIALELKLDRARADKTREALQKYVLSKIEKAGAPICEFRVTPSTWPNVFRKLCYLCNWEH